MKTKEQLRQPQLASTNGKTTTAPNEANFRALVQNSSDIITILGPDALISYVSPSIERILGYEPEAMIGVPAMTHVHPEDAAMVEAAIMKAIQSPDDVIAEFRYRHLNGEWIYLESIGRNRLDDPYINGIVINSRDITDRKRAEDALRQSEQRYQILFEDAPTPLWEEDYSALKAYIDGLRRQGVTDFRQYFADHPAEVLHCAQLIRIVDINQATLQLYQASSKQQMRDSLEWIFDEESIGAFRDAMIKFVVDGKTQEEVETTNRTLTGKKIHIIVRLAVPKGYEETLSKVFISVVDITERKRAEQALQESEERYQTLFEDSPISLWEEDSSALKAYLDALRAKGITDLNLYFTEYPLELVHCAQLVRIVDVNRATERLYGATNKAQMLANLYRVFNEETLQAFKEVVIALNEGKTQTQVETTNLTLTGETINTITRISVPPDCRQTLSRVLVSVVDITERKQAEEALRRSEADLKEAILESTRYNQQLLAVQTAGATIAASRDLEHILKTVTNEMTNFLKMESCFLYQWYPEVNSLLLMAESTRIRWPQGRKWPLKPAVTPSSLLNQVLTTGRSFQLATDRVDAASSKLEQLRLAGIKTYLLLPMEFQNQIIGLVEMTDSQCLSVFTPEEIRLAQFLANQAASAIGNMELHEQAEQEIMDRKQAQEELRYSEARLRALLDAIPDFICRISPDGRYSDCHFGQEVDFNLRRQQDVGNNIKGIFPSSVADLTLEYAYKALESGKTQIFEFQLPMAYGEQYYEARLVVSEENEVISIIRNITENKRAEQQRLQSERLAVLGRLTASFAHEVNNPLQIIQTNLDLFDYPLEANERAEIIQIVYKQINRLKELTDRVLSLTRLEVPLAEAVAITDLVEEALTLLGKDLKQRHINLVLDFQPVPLVRVVSNQVAAVFLNLLLNALEAMPEGGELVIAVYFEAGWVTISITNSGPGIPARTLARIFEPFFTTKSDGSGLGLWISYNLVQQNGGVLTVENLPYEQGVTFTVTLPPNSPEVQHDRK
jgi:PAS domain S-box-containing protein